MSKNLLNTELGFSEMIKIVKSGKSYLPICRSLSQHLLDVVEVALCKLQLLVKDNKEIEVILDQANIDENLAELHKLCNRSVELYSEIIDLPILKEDPDNLIELLNLSRIGSRYSELLSIIHTDKKYITGTEYPLENFNQIHVK